MSKLTIILSLIGSLFYSQNTRFIYEVTMKTDSTASPIIENAYLDTNGEKSFFYGEKRILRDSIMQKAFQTRNFNFDRSQMEQYRTKINYTIEKDAASRKIIFKNRIGRDEYSYEEDRALNWKIVSETTKIGDYKVQKAETDFAGRKWIAWFTQDIPLMDGPYKFSGLPGFIVKIEDAKGDYSFDLKKTKKIPEMPNLQSRPGNIISLKRKEYDLQMQKFQKDPASFMQNSVMMGGRVRMDIQNENPQDAAQRRKRMEERMKEEMKSNNNPIEK